MSKIRKIKDELKNMSEQQLNEQLESWEKELFLLRLNSATAHVKDYSQFKKLRSNVARAKTYLYTKKAISQ